MSHPYEKFSTKDLETYEQAADLSSSQGLYAECDSNGRAALSAPSADGILINPLGVIRKAETTAVGDPVQIQKGGVARMIAGEAITVYREPITVQITSSRAVVATGDDETVIGYNETLSTADGDWISVDLSKGPSTTDISSV